MDSDIARCCDMGSGNKLMLIRQSDGDIILQVLPASHRLADCSVEVCASGTQSPNTWAALIKLFEAMEQDQADRPHDVYPNRVVPNG